MHACLISHGQIIRISNLKLSTLFGCLLFIFICTFNYDYNTISTLNSYILSYCAYDIRIKSVCRIILYLLSYCVHSVCCISFCV